MHGAAVAVRTMGAARLLRATMYVWRPAGCCARNTHSRCCGCDIYHLFQVSGELASKGDAPETERGSAWGIVTEQQQACLCVAGPASHVKTTLLPRAAASSIAAATG
jgi:hypothetical protein